MTKLQSESEKEIRKIKSLKTSYAKDRSWGCQYACGGDLGIIHRFIETIDTLEVLHIQTFEEDVSGLWPVIFRHGNSLRSLTFHTDPNRSFDTITPTIVRQIASTFPSLTYLGFDISSKEAEATLKEAAEPRPLGQPREETNIDELVRIGNLKEVEVLIRLGSEASSFVGRNEWSAMGTISFPNLKVDACVQLARGIFDRFLTHNAQSSLEKVTVRFLRHCYQDRGQYDIADASVRVIRKGSEFTTEEDEQWNWDYCRVPEELWDVWGEIEQADLEFRR